MAQPVVGFDGWHEHFLSVEDALSCFAFGFSELCRLKVLYSGSSRSLDAGIEDRGAGVRTAPPGCCCSRSGGGLSCLSNKRPKACNARTTRNGEEIALEFPPEWRGAVCEISRTLLGAALASEARTGS